VIRFARKMPMVDVYANFANAWLVRVLHGSSFASELAEARCLMLADPHYDDAKYRAALLAADAIRNATIASS
jgi:hypothetical protein